MINKKDSWVFFPPHWSDWRHRPGRPAEGAECYPADAVGQRGPRYIQPTRSRRQWVGYHILMQGKSVTINMCTRQKSIQK